MPNEGDNIRVPRITGKIGQLNRVDRFILLLLGAKNAEPVPGPTHLQKEMYLLRNLFPELADEAGYEPNFLGPYSEAVAGGTERLASSDLIRADPKGFELTPDGKKVFDILKKGSSEEEEVRKAGEFKDLLNDLSVDELLAFVYFSHPSETGLEKESAEYRNLLPRRGKLAMSMYQRGKFSAQKAAQIAGVPLEDFLEGLKGAAR